MSDLTAGKYYDKICIELGYDDFIHWLDCSDEKMQAELIDLWTEGYARIKANEANKQPDTKALRLQNVMPRLIAIENYWEDQIHILTKDKEYEWLLKKDDLYCIVDNTGDIEIIHESFFNGA